MDKNKKQAERKKIDSKELYRIKEDLRKKLEVNTCFLADVNNPTSKAWKTFKMIKETETGVYTGYVRCMNCRGIHKHDSSGTGTSHLNKHVEVCVRAAEKASSGSETSKASATGTMTSYFKKSTPAVTKTMKKEMLQGAMAFCVYDMRPFEAVKGRGFEIVLETSMRLALKYGLIAPKDILPDPTTISRNLRKVVKQLRGRLVPFFQNLMERGFCSATTDMWSDDFKKTSYSTVTLQYTDTDWNTVQKVLFTNSYPDEKKKTGEHIREELISKFTSLGFDIDVVRKNVTFVTDQGPNMVKALEPPFKRMNCAAHLLNTILRNVFQPKELNENLPEVHRTIVATKALVAYLKHSGLSSSLKKTVHQEVETRWNTRLAMVQSVYDNFEDISILLNRKQQNHRLRDVNTSILKVLIEFLEPFKAASDRLEADGCTINFVLPEYYYLLSICRTPAIIAAEAAADETVLADPAPVVPVPAVDDDQADTEHAPVNDDLMDVTTTVSEKEILEYLKTEAYQYLKSKFTITETHKLATLLTPISKNIGLHQRPEFNTVTMSFEDRLTLLSRLRSLVAEENRVIHDTIEVTASQSFSDSDNSAIASTSFAPQPTKKQKTFETPNDRLKCLMQKFEYEPVEYDDTTDEVTRYLDYKFAEKVDADSDVLQWWRRNRAAYPIMANIAKKVFSIPASSASSERVFSAAGYIVQDRRSSLLADTVDAILFLNSNAAMKDFIIDDSDTDQE